MYEHKSSCDLNGVRNVFQGWIEDKRTNSFVLLQAGRQ